MRALFIAFACILTALNHGYAQSLPDYPSYRFVGQIGGVPQDSTFVSNAQGILTADANTYGSFHFMSLAAQGEPGMDLSFKYRCVWMNNDNQLVSSPTYSGGSSCPPGGAAQSRFVRAIVVELDGTNKDDYLLEYECWIGYFNQNRLDPFGRVPAGTMCGHETGGAPQEWLSRIVFYLRRK